MVVHMCSFSDFLSLTFCDVSVTWINLQHLDYEGNIFKKKDCKWINLFVLDQDFIQLRFSLRLLLLLNAELLTKLLKNRQKDSLFLNV